MADRHRSRCGEVHPTAGSPQRERLQRALAELPAGDVRRLAGEQRLWRLRVGGWRIIFERDDRARQILVLVVRPRGDAYKS